jgi:(p)ppGpp synthase/HD superfamily hydrolase
LGAIIVIVTAILHDIVEDTKVTAGMILDSFGRRIEEMVDRLTRVRPGGSKISVEEILNNAYEKDDKEVLLIKVIDRLHNMQTIGGQTIKKQKKTSMETLRILLHSVINIDDINLEIYITNIALSILDNTDQSFNGHDLLSSLKIENDLIHIPQIVKYSS